MVAAQRIGKIRCVIQRKGFGVIVDEGIEMFEEVLAQDTLNRSPHSGELAGVDPFNFKVFDTRVADSYAFRDRLMDVDNSIGHIEGNLSVGGNPQSFQKVIAD